jgi:hypothetical protein
MNLIKITKKEQSSLMLAGVTIEVDFVNESAKAIMLRDSEGRMLRVASDSEYSSLSLLVPQPPKMVDKWKLAGVVLGLKVEEFFDDEWAAKNRLDSLSIHLQLSESVGKNEKLEVSKVQVVE